MKGKIILQWIIVFLYYYFCFLLLGFFLRGCVSIFGFYKYGYFLFPFSEVKRIFVLSGVSSSSVFLFIVVTTFINWIDKKRKSRKNDYEN